MDDDLPDSPVPPRGLMGDCRFSVEILAWDLVATKIEGEEREFTESHMDALSYGGDVPARFCAKSI